MKRFSAILLAVVMLFGAVAMTSCTDPLEEKITEFNTAYDELGVAFYNAVNCCSFHEVYTTEYSDEFKDWSAILKAAKTEKKNYLDYTAEEMDEYITKWNTARDELNALAAKYPLPGAETVTDAVTE